MKFDKELPTCRTWHAELINNERLFIYGGTDLKKNDVSASELWFVDPLPLVSPEWKMINIKDDAFTVPDGIKGHQLAIRVINN